MQQRAPESVRRLAMANPIPRAPPVTIATRPCKSILFMRAALLKLQRAFVQPPSAGMFHAPDEWRVGFGVECLKWKAYPATVAPRCIRVSEPGHPRAR